MDQVNAIEDLTARFVEDIHDMARRVARDALAGALELLGSAPGGAQPQIAQGPGPARRARGATPARRPPASVHGADAQTAAIAASDAGVSAKEAVAVPSDTGAVNGHGHTPAPTGRIEVDPKPPSPRPAASRAAEREAHVLDALRLLVRGTAAEIAQRAGLPNGSAYVVLRSLVAKSRVARTETSRGIEYGLVSNGEVRPFKRARPTTAATDRAAEVPAAPEREPDDPVI
jgi:hypothetical protein